MYVSELIFYVHSKSIGEPMLQAAPNIITEKPGLMMSCR